MPTTPTAPAVAPVIADELLDDLEAQAKREADLQIFSALHNATIPLVLRQGGVTRLQWCAAYQIEREYIADEWLQSLLYNRLLERLEAMTPSDNPRLYAKVRNVLSFIQYAGRRQQYAQTRQSMPRYNSRGVGQQE